MTNRVLEIIFRLKDELTKNFNTMTKKFVSDSRRMASQINDISRASLMLGAAITGPMALAFHGAARHSRAVSDELDKVKTITAAWQLSVATAMIPTVQMLTDALGRLYQAWERLGPVMQTNIVKTGLWVGITLTLIGLWGRIAVVFIRAQAAIVALSSRLPLFMGRILLAVIALVTGILRLTGVIGLMIIFWDKVKPVVIPVLNAIEIGIRIVQIGFAKMIGGMVDGLITAAVHLSGFMKVLARVPGAQQEAFLAASDALDKFSGSLRKVSTESQKMVAQFKGDIDKILGTGIGGRAEKVDEFVERIRKKYRDLKKGLSDPGSLDVKAMQRQLEDLAKQTKTMHDVFIDTSTQAAQAMARSMGDFFFNPFSENVRSAKEMFADFGRSIMRILADVAAKWLITMTLGQFAPFNLLGLVMHSGGMIRAHNGYLARDEVPIIAQSGEAVLSRRGVAALGEDNINLLNRGGGITRGGVTINIPVVIQAWDTEDIYRNRRTITGIVGEEISKNGTLREVIRKYS